MAAYLILDDGTKNYPDIRFGGFKDDHWIKCVVRNSSEVGEEIVTEQDNMVGYFFVHTIEE